MKRAELARAVEGMDAAYGKLRAAYHAAVESLAACPKALEEAEGLGLFNPPAALAPDAAPGSGAGGAAGAPAAVAAVSLTDLAKALRHFCALLEHKKLNSRAVKQREAEDSQAIMAAVRGREVPGDAGRHCNMLQVGASHLCGAGCGEL